MKEEATPLMPTGSKEKVAEAGEEETNGVFLEGLCVCDPGRRPWQPLVFALSRNEYAPLKKNKTKPKQFCLFVWRQHQGAQ